VVLGLKLTPSMFIFTRHFVKKSPFLFMQTSNQAKWRFQIF